MTLADVITNALHLIFAGFWAGSVLFLTYAILPAAREGDLNAAPLASFAGKVKVVSRASAVFLLLTGGHMAGTRYTAESLFQTTNGHLVLTMVALWFVLAVLVEVGAKRLTAGTEVDKVREPARNATRLFQAASVVAVLLLLDAGAISGGLAGVI